MPRPTRTLLAVALALAGATAQAQIAPDNLTGGRPVRIEKDSAAARVVATVHEGVFSYVRIETREPGAAPNQHPWAVSAAALRAMLEQVQLAGKSEKLFSAKELDEVSGPLATALGRATAEQDVSFAVSDQFGMMGPLAARQVTTARVFRAGDGQLQLIAGLVRHDFESQFRGTGMLIAFEPGQRAKTVERGAKLAVAAGGGSVVRNDWIALNTNVAAAAAPAGMPAATPVAPAAAPATPATPAAAAPARDADALYRGAADRLRALEKLYKDGLISEAEYQEKRRQILREL